MRAPLFDSPTGIVKEDTGETAERRLISTLDGGCAATSVGRLRSLGPRNPPCWRQIHPTFRHNAMAVRDPGLRACGDQRWSRPPGFCSVRLIGGKQKHATTRKSVDVPERTGPGNHRVHLPEKPLPSPHLVLAVPLARCKRRLLHRIPQSLTATAHCTQYLAAKPSCAELP